MKFNKAECKVLHVGQDYPKDKYRLSRKWTESNPEKDLGMLVDKKLNMIWQCVFAAQNTKHILGCVKRNTASEPREVMLPFSSALVRPHLEGCIPL